MVAGDGKAVKIHLGGENELEDCRRQVTFYHLPSYAVIFSLPAQIFCFAFWSNFQRQRHLSNRATMKIEHQFTQVAEAAGLKHVALPEFENADGR